ncbi:hypothetical protein [Amycolatopsis sp. cmx-4-61]|uniref:hypothetical protein n=1 Tax=Amycolatopsis sp. cmx-4-61 TaxID=2790937 RepID=UPI00397E03C0
MVVDERGDRVHLGDAAVRVSTPERAEVVVWAHRKSRSGILRRRSHHAVELADAGPCGPRPAERGITTSQQESALRAASPH